MLKYRATIKDTVTGVIVTHINTFEHDEDTLKFYWTEGNFCCDCNRSTVFKMELGFVKCGGSRFQLLDLVVLWET